MNSKLFVPAAIALLLVAGIIAYFTIPEEKKSYPYQFTVVTIFKNDADWLKEWIEYNKAIGADHMLLYNNESSDNYVEVLDPYIKAGFVELFNFPNRPMREGNQTWVYFTQCPAYNDALKRLKGKSKWVTFIDTDEFIVPHHEDSILKALEPYDRPDIGGIAINWKCFGTSYVEEVPANKLMIEVLTKRMDLEHRINNFTKVIVKPEAVNRVANPHYSKIKKGYKLVHTNFSPVVHPESRSFENITLNHYYARTAKYARDQKIKKKEIMENRPFTEDEKRFYLETGNTHDDENYIKRFVPKVKSALHLE